MKKAYADENKFILRKRKRVCPYDYLNCEERLSETQLPSRSNFYNKMTDEECSIEDYDHAKKVWEIFECETIGC